MFRSLKRTHDFFLHDHALPLSKDEIRYRAPCNKNQLYSSVETIFLVESTCFSGN